MVKTCARCSVEQPVSEFTRSKTNTTGYHSYCKPCMRAYYLEKGGYDYIRVRQKGYRVAKREYVRARKVASGCVECGDTREPVLEFHHTNPATKSASVNALLTRMVTLERLDEEMAKCIVLCRNCHAMLHHVERTSKLEQTA